MMSPNLSGIVGEDVCGDVEHDDDYALQCNDDNDDHDDHNDDEDDDDGDDD